MKNLQIGHAKRVYRYLGFLADEYHMQCCFQVLPYTQGVESPTYIYTFYNDLGCFTIAEVAQRGEWDCYVAERFDCDPYMRMHKKVEQRSYIRNSIFTSHTFLRLTAKAIRQMIRESDSFWGIQIV